MNFWAELGRDLSVPSVQLAKINGRPCVAFKEGEDLPTTYISPKDPDNLRLILGLAIDIYISPDLSASQKARAALLELTTSVETLPHPDTEKSLGHQIHICIIDGPVRNCTP